MNHKLPEQELLVAQQRQAAQGCVECLQSLMDTSLSYLRGWDEIQIWEALTPGDCMEEVAFEMDMKIGLDSEDPGPKLGYTYLPCEHG